LCFFVFIVVFLQCLDTAGWVIRPVKYRLRNDVNCVQSDVKPCSTQLIAVYFACSHINIICSEVLWACVDANEILPNYVTRCRYRQNRAWPTRSVCHRRNVKSMTDFTESHGLLSMVYYTVLLDGCVT